MTTLYQANVQNGKFVSEFASWVQCLQEEFGTEIKGARFRFVDSVKTYPVFHFGGHSGTKVCTLAFEKILA